MMKLRNVILLVLCLLMLGGERLVAQSYQRVRGVRTAYWGWDSKGEEVLYLTLVPVNIYYRKRDLKNYERMVRAVKKVYPLAIEAAKRMEDLDAELSKFDKRRDRKAYTKAIEDALKEELTPMLWKMTRYEGKILLKLVDRETKYTAFAIVKEFRSGFTAGFYQAIAKLFGHDLKLGYDPKGEDEMLEQIVIYYKAGIL